MLFGEFSHLKKSIDDVSMELNDMAYTEWVGFSQPTDSLTDHLLEYDDFPIRELNDDPELMAWLDDHIDEHPNKSFHQGESLLPTSLDKETINEKSPRLLEGIICINKLSQRVFPMNMQTILARIKSIDS